MIAEKGRMQNRTPATLGAALKETVTEEGNIERAVELKNETRLDSTSALTSTEDS